MITAIAKDQGFIHLSSSADVNTNAATPTPNTLQVLLVSLDLGFNISTRPTVSGCGLTWTEVDGSVGGSTAIFLYVAQGPTPTTGNLTIHFPSGSYDHVLWIWDELAPVLRLSNPVLQAADNVGGVTQTLTITLAGTLKTPDAIYSGILVENTGNQASPNVGSVIQRNGADGFKNMVSAIVAPNPASPSVVWTWPNLGSTARGINMEVGEGVSGWGLTLRQ